MSGDGAGTIDDDATDSLAGEVLGEYSDCLVHPFMVKTLITAMAEKMW
jgi:hypothetical protein